MIAERCRLASSWPIVACLAATLVLTPPSSVSAGAIFQWLGPWRVTGLDAFHDEHDSAAAALGESSTSNGQITDTDANIAVVKLSGSAKVKGLLGMHASHADAYFERDFRLSGSPFGWYLYVVAKADGNLSASAERGDSFANILAGIQLSDRLPQFGAIVSDQVDNGGNRPSHLFDYYTYGLTDGTYTVTGEAIINAFTTTGFFGSASANANFFDVGKELQFRVIAVAIPEPPSLVLIGTGLAVCPVYAWHRRRRGSLP